MGSKKRLLVSKQAKRGANLLRYDPSRTNGLRRTFSAELNRRFRKLRMAVIDLVDKQDAFGLREREPFNPTANANPYHDALGRFAEGAIEAAKTSETGKFGENKTFISHAYKAYSAKMESQGKLVTSLDMFKQHLDKARAAGLVKLARSDLPQIHSARDTDESHMKMGGGLGDAHFIVHNYNPDQPRDSDGKFGSGGGPGTDTGPRGLMDHVKALGAKIGHAEHLAKVYVSDRIGAAVGKLPEGVQKGVIGAFGVTRFGTAAAFATWRAGQAMVERVAVERGATPEEARRLRGVLTSTDIATFKPISLGLHATGMHAATLGAVSMIPPASIGYLAYSTARDPMATLRAATGVVKDAARGLGKVGQKLYESKFNSAYTLNVSGDGYHYAMLMEDALRQHQYSDWYIAMLSVAMDTARNFEEALEIANAAWKKGGQPTINPFVSEAQRRWMHANHPEMAEKWEEHTPDDKDLPEKKEPTTNAGRFAFDSDPEKLEAFQEWLRQQFLGYLAGASEEELWNKFIMEGFKKGARRAYDDYYTKSRWDVGQGKDFYAGSKKQFLQSSFAQPESLGKVKLLASRSFDELQNVTADMSNKMSRVLTTGLVRGMNPHDIARELADEVDLGQTRATVIARTEIVRAHAEGQLQAFEDMGVEELGVMVEWSTAGDERVCDDCEPMEGVVLKLDEAKGMIPRHPQCRCAFIPANVGEDKEGQQRSKSEITGAIKESQENAGDTEEDWGPGKGISKDRPESVLNQYKDRDDILGHFLSTMEAY